MYTPIYRAHSHVVTVGLLVCSTLDLTQAVPCVLAGVCPVPQHLNVLRRAAGEFCEGGGGSE